MKEKIEELLSQYIDALGDSGMDVSYGGADFQGITERFAERIEQLLQEQGQN